MHKVGHNPELVRAGDATVVWVAQKRAVCLADDVIPSLQHVGEAKLGIPAGLELAMLPLMKLAVEPRVRATGVVGRRKHETGHRSQQLACSRFGDEVMLGRAVLSATTHLSNSPGSLLRSEAPSHSKLLSFSYLENRKVPASNSVIESGGPQS